MSDEALDLHVLSTSWMSKAARNPGVVAVAVATVVTLFAGRDLPGGLLHRLETGLTGGELVGVRADSRTLWHAWLDGWHGAALGHSGEQSPHLAVLAALAWVGEHLPGADPASSPVGAAVAALLGLALPLATLTAYLAARVITRAGWARALAALAWSSTAVVTTAVGGGRLGAVVAAILLPLVAAGFALAARRGSRVMATAATALGCAVLGAFVPAMLVLGAAAALALLVLGRGRGPRLRGLALLLVPPALMGPWLLELIESPYLLLSGPGLTLWGQETALPWQIALAHPGGPGSTPVLFTAPLVLAGVAGLLRAGRRSAAATSLAVLAIAGLALALAAPRVTLGTVPVGVSQAGEPITAWPGIGLLPYVLALLAAALLGADRLPLRRSAGGWLAVSRWPLWAAVAAAVLASAGWTAWRAVGSELSAWSDPRPAVAVDQAEGDPSNRMLLLETAGEQVHYRLLGREVSDVARSLPMTSEARPADSGLATAVGLIFEQGGSPDGPKPGPALAAQGVGFVGLRAEQTDPAIRTLDAVAGLSRLGEHQGVLFWRVLPADGVADAVVAPSRARIVSTGGVQTVPVSGDHGRLSAEVTAGRGARLVMAEPAGVGRPRAGDLQRRDAQGQPRRPAAHLRPPAVPRPPRGRGAAHLPALALGAARPPGGHRLPGPASGRARVEESLVIVSTTGIVRAVLAAGAGVGLVYAAMQAPGAVALGPAANADTTRDGATSTVRSSQLVCPGPELKGLAGLDDLPVDVTVAAAAAPVRALTGLSLPRDAGAFTIAGLAAGSKGVSGTARGVVASTTASDAAARSVRGSQSLAPGLAAAQSWLVDKGDQRGLGMAPCGRPTADAWLLAGGGAPGRQERLVLTNPGDNPVTVDLTLHGAKGPVSSPNGKGVVVPSRGRTTVLLDSISGTETSPAVHVVTHGGSVHAVLDDFWLDGVVAAAARTPWPPPPRPATRSSRRCRRRQAATVRVAVPGDDEAVVQTRVLTNTGPKALPGDAVVRVAGGTVRDISIDGLPIGVYAVQVRADVPVVAAAIVQRRPEAERPSDFAWAARPRPSPTSPAPSCATQRHRASSGRRSTSPPPAAPTWRW